MKKYFKYTIAAACLVVTEFAVANNTGPSLNAACNHKVTMPKSASEIKFNESCSEIFVAPPRLGRAEIVDVAPTTNLQFCPAIKRIDSVTNSTFDSITNISGKIERMIKDFEPMDKDIIKLRQDLAESEAARNFARTKLEQAETQIQKLREALRNAKKDYEMCTEANPADARKCNLQKLEWEEARLEFDSFRQGEYRESRDHLIEAEEDFETFQKRMEELQRRYTEAISPLIQLQKSLVELHLLVMDLYRDYVRLEGATGQILWTVRWSELVNEFRALNPQLPVQWSKLALKEAQLVASMRLPNASNEIELATIPAIKSAIIPGAKATGFAGMGNGDKAAGLQLQPSSPTQASVAFGDSVSGQIVLTLLGACPFFNGIETRTNISFDKLTVYMVPNLIYSYEVAARRGYTAKHNLSNLLNKIEERVKRGGLFTTEAANSIAEDGYSRDWIEIKFDGNSSEFQYSAEEQNHLSVTVKKELIDRAMKQFAVFYAGSSVRGQIPNFVESGAYRSSAELRKCFLTYCQVASAVLGVADSIWGNSRATASFHRNNNVWVTERVSGIQFVTRSGALSFRHER